STSYTVTCNFISIGWSAGTNLTVTGTTFSVSSSIISTIPTGDYSFPCTVTDDLDRTSSFTITLTLITPPAGTCGSPSTAIDLVQGPGATSPMVGQVADVEGIVVGSYQGAGQLGGFYLEEQDATQDNDPQTSEGIFVAATTPS